MTDEDVLPIVQCGDPVLRRPAEPVDPAGLHTAELRRLIAQMRATMEAAPGVGLAAPQVGVPLQLAVLQDGPERWGKVNEDELAARERYELPFTVLVNPTVTPVDGNGLAGFYEGCLSVPGLAALVASAESVGIAQWCVDTASSYAQDRIQFGRPIGQFQAVKHRCADMLVDGGYTTT